MFDRFNGEDITGAEYDARRKHTFVIPDRAFEVEIDPESFAIYSALSRWSDALGYVRISDAFIVERYNRTPEIVARSIEELERMELIIVHERDDGEGLYSLPDLQALNELNE